MIINKVHSDNDLLYKMYEDLSEYEFIPKLEESRDLIDTFSVNDGRNALSLSKDMLISLADSLGSIRKYGYSHNNLTLDNLLFSDSLLVGIIGWDNVTLDKSVNDFLYIIDNYIDLVEDYYSNDYALDLILTISEHYDKYTDNLDLGYEMYWYFINKMNKYNKDSKEYELYDNKLRFVIKYKPYLDELHEEEI